MSPLGWHWASLFVKSSKISAGIKSQDNIELFAGTQYAKHRNTSFNKPKKSFFNLKIMDSLPGIDIFSTPFIILL